MRGCAHRPTADTGRRLPCLTGPAARREGRAGDRATAYRPPRSVTICRRRTPCTSCVSKISDCVCRQLSSTRSVTGIFDVSKAASVRNRALCGAASSRASKPSLSSRWSSFPDSGNGQTVLNLRLPAVRWKQCASYMENAILDAAVVGIDLALGRVASVGTQRVAGKEGRRLGPGYLFAEGRRGPETDGRPAPRKACRALFSRESAPFHQPLPSHSQLCGT